MSLCIYLIYIHVCIYLFIYLSIYLSQNTSGVYRCSDVPSSTYSAVLDGTGELYCGIGDINIEEHLDNTWVCGNYRQVLIITSYIYIIMYHKDYHIYYILPVQLSSILFIR